METSSNEYVVVLLHPTGLVRSQSYVVGPFDKQTAEAEAKRARMSGRTTLVRKMLPPPKGAYALQSP